MTEETYEQMMKDSDTIFTAITSGDFPTMKLARGAIVMCYVPDMSFSRAGISHALKRLEEHYRKVGGEV